MNIRAAKVAQHPSVLERKRIVQMDRQVLVPDDLKTSVRMPLLGRQFPPGRSRTSPSIRPRLVQFCRVDRSELVCIYIPVVVCIL
jgi:hypothetical protein